LTRTTNKEAGKRPKDLRPKLPNNAVDQTASLAIATLKGATYSGRTSGLAAQTTSRSTSPYNDAEGYLSDCCNSRGCW